MRLRRVVLLLVLTASPLFAQNHAATLAHIHGELGFLAGDSLRGRRSASQDEFVAASYVASQFQTFGVDEVSVQVAVLPSGAKTYNAVGILRGSDAKLAREVLLLTSHLDHLGVRNTSNGEAVFHGADDDASGTTAVLELARFLAARRPRRTVVFACFGSEETGGQGNQYFLENPPVPLPSIVANLEFEMIGQPDPMLKTHQLFLTGWERSNLGPELARRGAPLTADPHPEQKFFQRSDNIALAHRGIVAQTVSSYGLGKHYHSPEDDLAHIDFEHMAAAIESMLEPVLWLANTDWRPSWKASGRP